MNKPWQAVALTAATLLAGLCLLALDGLLAKAEPKTVRYRILHSGAVEPRLPGPASRPPLSSEPGNRIHLRPTVIRQPMSDSG